MVTELCLWKTYSLMEKEIVKWLIIECIKMLTAAQKYGARSGRRGMSEGRAAF